MMAVEHNTLDAILAYTATKHSSPRPALGNQQECLIKDLHGNHDHAVAEEDVPVRGAGLVTESRDCESKWSGGATHRRCSSLFIKNRHVLAK